MKVFRMATAAVMAALLVVQVASAAPPVSNGNGYYNASSSVISTSFLGGGGSCCPSTCCEPACCEPACCEPACCEPACCDPCDACCDACDSCCSSCCDTCFMFGPAEPLSIYTDECRGITLGGWTAIGYVDNAGLPVARFNDRPGELNLTQQWMYAEMVADGSCGLGFGGRIDVIYGTDGRDTQAFGNQPGVWDFQNGFDHGAYSWAIPQLYGEVAYGDLSVKIGHFYTLVGYEVVPAPDNFFYSHSFTMVNSEPFTHTGALGSYALNDAVTVYSGWTLGWDSGFDSALNDGSNYIGGLGLSLTDNISATWICTAGKFGPRGDGYMQSFVADVALLDNVNYVFQTDYLTTDLGEEDYGVNQYLFLSLNDCVAVGTRFEWWRDDVVNTNRTSYYEWTNGLNIRPMANVNIRPEVRYEWSPALNQDEVIFGIDSYLVF